MRGLTSITVLVTLLAIGKRFASACESSDECDAGNACVSSPFTDEYSCYPASCESGWILEEGKCYFFSTEETNWDGANAACASKDAALAEIYDEKMNNFLRTEVQNRNDRYFWLGASDKAEEGNWAWNSGAPWDFEDWMNDQPDDYMGENCLHAYSRSWGIGWNDWSCDKSGAYLCEKDAEVEFDPCEGNPCANGGTCEAGDNDYTCSCALDTAGENCELTCPEGWIMWADNCFFFSTDESNWDDANAACASEGASLAEILNSEMDAFVLAEAEKRADRYFWIGGSDKAEEGNWEWNSGASWDYEGWKLNQPDDLEPAEDCLHVYWSSDVAGWNDWGCERIGAYLCQKEPSN